MIDNANLFWFGSLLEICFVIFILRAVGSPFQLGKRVKARQLTKDYLSLQQPVHDQKEQLSETLPSQSLQPQVAQPAPALTEWQNQLQQQTAQLNQEHLNVQALQQQVDQLTQECLSLRQELQQQQERLTDEFHQTTFNQLQTLLINYPSASKIAQLKADLPAKNLTPILTPLDDLIHSWGYDVIGPVWEQVAYNPQFHQTDDPDIQPGDLVYIRYVGYRNGEQILCPAKVSRTLPGTRKDTPDPISPSSISR